jgi:hypothetical protein
MSAFKQTCGVPKPADQEPVKSGFLYWLGRIVPVAAGGAFGASRFLGLLLQTP